MPNQRKNTKAVIGPVRFSYANVWVPKSMGDDDSNAKYSVSIIIPKSDKKTIKAVNLAIENAAANALNEVFGGKDPHKIPNFKWPLRDGDEERPDDEAYADSYFLNASSKQAPGIVDRNRQKILDQTEFYSGCYGYADINFYGFNTSGNRGIAAGLNNLMKTKDGPAMGGRESAESAFADIEVEDDDEI